MRNPDRRYGPTEKRLHGSGGAGRTFPEVHQRNFVDKIGNPDAMIVFTNKISHEAKRKAVQVARSRNIPLQMVHSCGVSSLRECLKGA